MNRIRISLIAAGLSALVLGAAIAKEPPDGPGGSWVEYTYYDSNGNAIGGRWKDCTGHVATWGTTAGRFEVTSGPCP